jgi:hypothetical protein
MIVVLAAAGVIGGLVLFARGLFAYMRSQRISGIGSSPIASIAAGEVRVSGSVEPDALTLVSPLQSEPCVYFRSRVTESAGRDSRTVFSDQRAVGFRVRDASGSIRVFPRGARWEVPTDFDEGSGFTGDTPIGLRLNDGPTVRGVAEDDRQAQIDRLLTVRPAAPSDSVLAMLGSGDPNGGAGLVGAGLGGSLAGGLGGGTRRYVEARVSPGDPVTIIGWALPFGQLDDPAGADVGGMSDAAALSSDPDLAATIAEARAEGILESSPEEAWGNAAIPGFGIGRPVRPPELDPGVMRPELAAPEQAEQAERRFEIPDEELVLAVGTDAALAIFDGEPGVAARRERDRFMLGIVGALIAIASALALAYMLRGEIP